MPNFNLLYTLFWMLILTNHCKERIAERYPWSESQFIKEVWRVLKDISKKKHSHYKKKKWENWETTVWFRQHKIIFIKKYGNYVIITYWTRNVMK